MIEQKKRKVLFTSHTANFSKFNRPFMVWFKGQGYEVHYASAGEENVKDCDKHFTVPFERSPLKARNIRAIRALKKIIDDEEYDLIHTHTPMGSVITRIAARSARKNGTRIMYTAHGFHFFKGAPLANWLVYYPIERWLARYTDTLITINQEDYARAKQTFKTNVAYIPGVGIDPLKFQPRLTQVQKSKLRFSLGLDDDDFVMIYPAEISKRKNQVWLVNALAYLMRSDPSVHLLLPGQDSLRNRCHKLVKELGLEKNVHFLGYRSDIPQLMMISDMAVSSSTQEGLPVNILEAMYAGLPIIATDCRGNRDLIVHDKNGYILDLKSPDTFIEKIEYIRMTPRVQDSMKRFSRNLAERYVLETILKRKEAIYKKVLS